jgi:predicted lipoprotein with Yx(FWY)xxD motif
MRKSTMMALAAGFALSAVQTLTAAAAIDHSALKIVQTPVGKVFTDAGGMTLYTYDGDMPGVSRCTGECARHWPPAKAEAGARATGELSLITRDDGTRQWADKGMPLYRFAQDKKPGDREGTDMNGVWHVATPD